MQFQPDSHDFQTVKKKTKTVVGVPDLQKSSSEGVSSAALRLPDAWQVGNGLAFLGGKLQTGLVTNTFFGWVCACDSLIHVIYMIITYQVYGSS